MNVFTKNKIAKKFIIILVLLILFNFSCPKTVRAGWWDDVKDALAILPARILYMIEIGLLEFANNIFVKDSYKADIDSSSPQPIRLTPENIIKGKFLLFDANIFKAITDGSKYYDYSTDAGDIIGNAVSGGKTALRDIVAGWYYALRNFAIVALLSVLVYVGIRMIISTIAQDKAKYKVMFKDWLVALCLVIMMHYIMIAILDISSLITQAFGGGQNTNLISSLVEDINGLLNSTNPDNEYNGMTTKDAYAKVVVLGGLLIYTFIFAVKYLKREFTIIFLILLGPISCVTYPIDKISDGKAQAFNRWFTEFLYQVIIQPFHLLLYIVLVGSATQLADANILYTIVCFAIMIPAEKFVKEMFGFKDKLGSPLGAFAGGAMASNLLNSLMKSGKGGSGSGGSGKDGDDKSSTQNELPPKTSDDSALVEGSEDDDDKSGGSPSVKGDDKDEPDQELNNDNQDPNSDVELNDSNVDGEGEEESDVELDDPTVDGEGEEESSEEESDVELDDPTAEGEGEEESNTEQPSEENGDEPEKLKAEKGSIASRIRDSKFAKVYNQRASKKYGTTNKKERWKKRAVKGGKTLVKGSYKVAKGVLKAAAIGTVGGAAITGALLTGNGKKAMAMASGIATYAGKKGLDFGKQAANYGKEKLKGAKGAAKDYFNAYRDDLVEKNVPFVKSKEEKEFDKFKADSKEIDKAVYSYRKNHDGEDPGYADLEKEMEDRFALSRYGLKDDDIDDCLPTYQDKKKELEDKGLDSERASQIAANQAKYTANLAKAYNGKDFRDESVMAKAYDRVKEGLKERTGCSDKDADKYARQYLTDAAKMKGVSDKELKLPSATVVNKETVDIPIKNDIPDVSTMIFTGDSKPTEDEIRRINEITFRLREEGFSPQEIITIAQGKSGDNVTNVIDEYKATVEYLDNEDAREQAKITIEQSNGGRNATDKQVKAEMKERLILKSTFNVQKENDISALRDLEKTELKGKTQIQAAREFANENRGQLNNEAHMKSARENLIEKLKAGGSSRDKARKDAENIINLAGRYTGEVSVGPQDTNVDPIQYK